MAFLGVGMRRRSPSVWLGCNAASDRIDHDPSVRARATGGKIVAPRPRFHVSGPGQCHGVTDGAAPRTQHAATDTSAQEAKKPDWLQIFVPRSRFSERPPWCRAPRTLFDRARPLGTTLRQASARTSTRRRSSASCRTGLRSGISSSPRRAGWPPASSSAATSSPRHSARSRSQPRGAPPGPNHGRAPPGRWGWWIAYHANPRREPERKRELRWRCRPRPNSGLRGSRRQLKAKVSA